MGLLFNRYDEPNIPVVIAGVLVLGTALIGGCTAITNNWHRGEGDRVGMINKISRTGMFWETWEGQMALEGIVSGGDSVGANVWNFAVDEYWPKEKRDEIITKLRGYMDSGQKVKIHYEEKVCTFSWRSGSDYLIQSIEPVSVALTQGKTRAERSLIEEGPTSQYGKEIVIDGKTYLLRHDKEGNLKINKLESVQ